MVPKPSLDNVPQRLNHIEVGRICGPVEHVDPLLLEPDSSGSCSMGRGQVVLDYEIGVAELLFNRRK